MVANELGAERRSPSTSSDAQRSRQRPRGPARGRPRPLGVLAVYSLEARGYVQDDVNPLRSAGNVLAAAIARARTEDEVREANSLLHGVVEDPPTRSSSRTPRGATC